MRSRIVLALVARRGAGLWGRPGSALASRAHHCYACGLDQPRGLLDSGGVFVSHARPSVDPLQHSSAIASRGSRVRGAATIGVFLVPWFLATAAAQLLRRLVQHSWLHAFSRGAGPAVVALLVVGARGVTRATYTGRRTVSLRWRLWRWVFGARSTRLQSLQAVRWSGRRAHCLPAVMGRSPVRRPSLGAALLQEIANVRDVSWGLEPVESV